MLTRRGLIGGVAAVGLAAPARAAAILTDDGLYRQPWFLESFLELGDDLQGATTAGKRFALLWELRGCPYCKETHLVNFARPDIEAFISEKALAAKYGVRFTPTVQFFPEAAAGLAEKPPDKREVARAPGYLRPDDFLALFRFVREKGYETRSFRDYLRAARS